MHECAQDLGQHEEPKHKIETYRKVYQTMKNWQRTVMMHIEFQVQEVSNTIALKEAAEEAPKE